MTVSSSFDVAMLQQVIAVTGTKLRSRLLATFSCFLTAAIVTVTFIPACFAQAQPSAADSKSKGVTESAPRASSASNPRTVGKPLWIELTAAQREALAPLAQRWDTLPSDRKKKWLEVAPKYFALSDEGRVRMHDRMLAFVNLTPEQRETTRENFKRAANMPLETRQALAQQYRELPQEERDALARKADTKPETQRRTEREAKIVTSKPASN